MERIFKILENEVGVGRFSLKIRDVLFLLFGAIYIYLHLFIPPTTPIFYENDHTALMNDVLRFYNGEIIYKDFFELTFPGTLSLYYIFFLVFGPKFWILDFVILLNGIACAALCLAISKKVIGDTIYAYIPPSLFLFVGFRWFGIDGEHRLISPFFACLAIYFLLKEITNRRIVLAGISCALASFFTQQRGIVAVVAIGIFFFIRFGILDRDFTRFFKSSLLIGCVFAFTLGLLLLPFIWAAGFDNFYTCTVVFLQNYVQDPNTNSLATYFITIQKVFSIGYVIGSVSIFYYILIPLIYIFGLVYFFRRRKSDENFDDAVLVCLLGIMLFAATVAPNPERQFQIAIPAFVLLGFLISKTKLVSHRVVKFGLAITMIVSAGLAVRVQTAWQINRLTTPRGEIAFVSPIVFERYKWLAENTSPGDEVYETYNAMVNFPLDKKNPSYVSVLLNSDYNTQGQFDRALQDVKDRRPRYILWDASWTPEIKTLAEGQRLRPFYEFLIAHYTLRKTFTPYDKREREVWEINR